jgi:hypothetical protein
VAGNRKEVYDVASRTVRIFDVEADPGELNDLAEPGARPSEPLQIWLRTVREGLKAASDIPAAEIDAESEAHLKALGYLD